MIFNQILASAAYGGGAMFCAYRIAPRAKQIVVMVFAGLILILSVFVLIVNFSQEQFNWMSVLELAFINVGSIYVAFIVKNDEL